MVALALCSCAGAGDRDDVESAFRGYHAALLARDFPAACAVNSPEATERLLASVATQGIEATTCEEAFTAIFSEEGAAATADGIASTVQVQEVAVTGEDATVTWTALLSGELRTATNDLRRVDGRWMLVASS